MTLNIIRIAVTAAIVTLTALQAQYHWIWVTGAVSGLGVIATYAVPAIGTAKAAVAPTPPPASTKPPFTGE